MTNENGAAAPANGAEPVQPGTPARRPWRRFVLLSLLLTGGAAYGWHWWQQSLQYVTTDNAALAGDLLPVTSELAGRVADVPVAENDTVEAGQLLVALDARPYEIALQQAEAELHVAEQQAEAARANISVVQSQARGQALQASGGVAQAGAGVGTAQAQVDQAEATAQSAAARVTEQQAALELARTKHQRYADLAAKGYVSQAELDSARAELATSEARAEAAQEDLKTARARVAQAQAGVEQAKAQRVSSSGQVESAAAAREQAKLAGEQSDTAEAQVEVRQAEVAEARLNLERTQIHAVTAGRVGRKAVAPGQQVAPGQSLLALVPPGLWVEANFKETQLRRLHAGQPVEIDVDALPGVHFSGTLESFSPASGATFSLLPPENATGNFTKVVQRIPVHIALDSASIAGYEEQLAPGMSVIVKVKVR